MFSNEQELFSDDPSVESGDFDSMSPVFSPVSDTVVDIMEYIAGFVVRKLKKKLKALFVFKYTCRRKNMFVINWF